MTKEALLKRQQYHWFWGLRTFSSPQQTNLLMTVQAWTPEQAAAIRQKQVNIEEMFIIARFFYAIFNWDHYAEDGYLLNAYDWLASSLPHTTGESTVMTSFWNWIPSAPNVVDIFLNFFETYDSDDHASFTQAAHTSETFQDDRAASAQPSSGREPCTDEARRNDTPAIRDGILITALMLPHVQSLGINAALGAPLCLLDLTRAYRKNALLFHPDKNPSPEAGQQFLLVSTAFEKLKACFDNPQLGLSMDHSACASSSWETLAELGRKLDDLERSYAGLRESFVEMNKESAEMRATQTEIRESYQTLMTAALNRQKQLEEMQRKVDEMHRKVDGIAAVTHEREEEGQIATRPVSQNNSHQMIAMLFPSPLSELSHVIRSYQSHSLYFFRSVAQLRETQRTENQPVLMICDRPASSSN